MENEKPIDVVLHCPNCKTQHIDKPSRKTEFPAGKVTIWDNPPHRSHLCGTCGCIWRPCDLPTNGVEFSKISTKGITDTYPENR